MVCMFIFPNMSATLASCQRKCANQMTTPEREDLLPSLKMEKEDLASMLTVIISEGRPALKKSLLGNCNISNWRKGGGGGGERGEGEEEGRPEISICIENTPMAARSYSTRFRLFKIILTETN